jgi:acetyl-CoA carboxylase/biotin carboxylase 1
VEAASKPASNKVGMLAWKLTMCTPEYPGGRDLVLISNDITFANGTFGPPEDVVFQRASEYARQP